MATRVRCLKCSKIIECDPYDTSILLTHIKTEHPEIILSDDDLADGIPADPCEWDKKDMRTKKETSRKTCRRPVRTRKDKYLSPQIPRSPQKRRLYKTSIERWRPANGTIYCPKCGCKKRPIIRSRSEKMSYTPAGAACILTCWPLCFLPCLFSSLTKEYLHCAECNNFLGMYDKHHNCVRPNKDFVDDYKSRSSDRLCHPEEPQNMTAEPMPEEQSNEQDDGDLPADEIQKEDSAAQPATYCLKILNDPLHGRMSGTMADPWHGLLSKQAYGQKSGQPRGKMYTLPQELMSVYKHGTLADPSHAKMSTSGQKSVKLQTTMDGPSQENMSRTFPDSSHGQMPVRSEADPSHRSISVSLQTTEADLSIPAHKTMCAPMSTQLGAQKSIDAQTTMDDPSHESMSSVRPNPSHGIQSRRQKSVRSHRQKAIKSNDLASVPSEEEIDDPSRGHLSFKAHKTEADPSHWNMSAPAHKTVADPSHVQSSMPPHELKSFKSHRALADPSQLQMSTQLHGRKSVKSQKRMNGPLQGMSVHSVRTSHGERSSQSQEQKSVRSHGQKSITSHGLTSIPSENYASEEEDAEPSPVQMSHGLESHNLQSQGLKSIRLHCHKSIISQKTKAYPSHGNMSVSPQKPMTDSLQGQLSLQSHGKNSHRSHGQKSIVSHGLTSISLEGYKPVNFEEEIAAAFDTQTFPHAHGQKCVRLHWKMDDPTHEQMSHQSQRKKSVRLYKKEDFHSKSQESTRSIETTPATSQRQMSIQSEEEKSIRSHRSQDDHENIAALSHGSHRTMTASSQDEISVQSLTKESIKSVPSLEDIAAPSHGRMPVQVKSSKRKQRRKSSKLQEEGSQPPLEKGRSAEVQFADDAPNWW